MEAVQTTLSIMEAAAKLFSDHAHGAHPEHDKLLIAISTRQGRCALVQSAPASTALELYKWSRKFEALLSTEAMRELLLSLDDAVFPDEAGLTQRTNSDAGKEAYETSKVLMAITMPKIDKELVPPQFAKEVTSAHTTNVEVTTRFKTLVASLTAAQALLCAVPPSLTRAQIMKAVKKALNGAGMPPHVKLAQRMSQINGAC